MSKTRLALFAFGAALCAASAPAVAGDGTHLTSLIPADTQMIMVFDVADARDSSLLQKGYQALLAAAPDAQQKLTELGLDPIKDIDTILFAGGGVTEMSDMGDAKSKVLIIEGRLPKDKLKTLPGAKKSTYAGVDIYSNDDTDAAFVGDRLFFTGKGKLKGVLDVALGKKKNASVATSPKAKKLRDAIATTDTSADAWLTVLIPDKDKKEMAQNDLVADSIAAGANFTKDLGLLLRINSTSEDAAAKAVGMIQGSLGQATSTLGTIGLGKAAKSIQVSQDKASIKMAITLTEAELDSLLSLAGVGGGAPAPASSPAPAGGGALGKQPPKSTPTPAPKKTP
ncbi:MAG TPA: hypothetical protein VM734_30205 [Kofleriaceae bacterium]|nr:hypothetical protein [Kofleriaceae bacterium]